VTTDEEYESTRKSLEQIPDVKSSYTAGQALEGARQFAADIGREMLEGVGSDWEAVGRVGNERDQILTTADEYGCDHVFLAGDERTPAGKALFGDTTQSVILDFDGTVTVVTE
jgi:nucleotide-binding universal stress UspA family protein